MTSRLEKAANVATVTVALLAGVMAVFNYWPKASNRQPYPIGAKLPSLPHLNLGSAQRTIIAVVKRDCPACEASMPLYRRIIDVRNRTSASIQFVVMGFDSESALKDYVVSRGVVPDAVISAQRAVLLVRSTPTLILTNSTALVQRLWVGGRFEVKNGRIGENAVWAREVLWRAIRLHRKKPHRGCDESMIASM